MYFGVHQTTKIPPINRKGEIKPPVGVRSQIAFIAVINALFGEYDDKDHGDDHAKCFAFVQSLEIPPSVIVDSGGGYHCYWLLDQPWFLIPHQKAQMTT